MILNPPKFKISPKCCKYAKKDPIHEFIKDNDFDLNCYGVRKAEGGARSTAYKNCFTNNAENEDRPIYWYKEDTKKIYEEDFNIKHSKCYREYGLKRTGCAGCPFNQDFEEELRIIQNYEPKLFNAANNIFKDSYEYTRAYRKFVKENFKNTKRIDQIFKQIEFGKQLSLMNVI